MNLRSGASLGVLQPGAAHASTLVPQRQLELEEEVKQLRQALHELKGQHAELKQENQYHSDVLLGFQLASGLGRAPTAVERRDDGIIEGESRRMARVMRTIPLVLSTPPDEQRSWPAHLDARAYTPHLERMCWQLALRDQVRDLQEVVQRLARAVRRSLVLRAVTDTELGAAAPWRKPLKPFELPSSLAGACKQLLVAAGFKAIEVQSGFKMQTHDMAHVIRLIGPSATCDRSNKLTTNFYFKSSNKRKKEDYVAAIPEEWKAVVPNYLFEVRARARVCVSCGSLFKSFVSAQMKNTFDLMKRDILKLYEEDSMDESDWHDIKDLEGYAAVVVNELHPFIIEYSTSASSFGKLHAHFSYGGVYRITSDQHEFHDLWRGRMPASA